MVDEDAKAALRQRLRNARRDLDAAQREVETSATCALIQRWLATRDGVPASYVATGSELCLAAVHAECWGRGAPVLLPRVDGHDLVWHLVEGPEQLKPGYRGILEPDAEACPQRALDTGSVVLMPGLGFDSAGGRLGQGGGFYDRALAALQNVVRIGVGFRCQGMGRIPMIDHDVHLDGVILGGDWLRPLSAEAP